MSYQLYAYRPVIGVAVAKKGNQWLMIDLEDRSGESKLISEADSLRISNHFGLIDAPRTFATFSALSEFLRHEYLDANPKSSQAIQEDDLDFLDSAFILDWLHDLHLALDHQQFDDVNPRVVLESLATVARHPKFEQDPEVLTALVPLKNAWERQFAMHHLRDNVLTEAVAAALEQKFPALNGSTLRMRESVRHFAPLC